MIIRHDDAVYLHICVLCPDEWREKFDPSEPEPTNRFVGTFSAAHKAGWKFMGKYAFCGKHTDEEVTTWYTGADRKILDDIEYRLMFRYV